MCLRTTILLALSILLATGGTPAAAATPQDLHRDARVRGGIQTFLDAALERHPAPFLHHPEAEWRQVAGRLLTAAPELDDVELFIGLGRMIGMLRDGHSSVWLDGDSALLGDAVPLRFWHFEDGVYVRAAAPEWARLAGARVMAVSGVPIEEVWSRLEDSRPGETPSATRRSAAVLLQIPRYLEALDLDARGAALRMTLEHPDGSREEVDVPTRAEGSFSAVWSASVGLGLPDGWAEPPAASEATWLARRTEPFFAEVLTGSGTLYVQVARSRRYTDEDDPDRDAWLEFVEGLPSMAAEGRVDHVVVDLRHNRGGDSSLWQALAHALLRVPAARRPGGVRVLIGRLTESAGVVLATKLEQELPAVFVGEPSASRPNFFNDHRPWSERELYRIPGTAITMRVSRVQEQWSAPQDRRTMLLPDVPVTMRWSDFAGGRDPALQAAVSMTEADASALFVEPDGARLTEPWSHPWRASQRPAWLPLRFER